MGKPQPTPSRKQTRSRQRRVAEQMQEWLGGLIEARKQARQEAAEDPEPTPERGVDRVPARLRDLPEGEPRVLVEHIDATRQDRRFRETKDGRTVKRAKPLPARNTPYTNQDKDRALPGKARRRARREARRES